MAGARVLASTLGACLACCSCASGLPQLQPAQVLPAGASEASVGASGELILGAKAGRQSTPVAETRSEELSDTLVEALRGPGLSPWLSARLGIKGDNEASLIYSGRHARVGFRHCLADGKWALSIGAGGSALFYRGTGVPASAHGPADGAENGQAPVWRGAGWGVDLPVSFGWQSQAEIIAAWLGVRAGMQRLSGEFGERDLGIAGSGIRFDGSTFLGFSIGVHPIRVRAELTATLVSATGKLELGSGRDVRVRAGGLSLSPASSFGVQF